MRILTVSSSISASAGGIAPVIHSLNHRFVLAGETVKLIAGGTPGDAAELQQTRLPCELFAFWPPRSVGYHPGFTRAMTAFAPDIVHSHGIWMYPGWAAGWAARKLKVPFVVSPHGMLDPWALKNSAWKKQIAAIMAERNNLSRATCLHALNESEYRSIRAFGLKNPVAILPNGIELSEVPPRSSAAGRRRLLFLGRLHPKKGLVNLLYAWSKIRQNYPSMTAAWQLVFAGWDDGGHFEELKTLAGELGIKFALCDPAGLDIPEDADLVFTGPRYGQQKEQLFELASAFILPSYSEGLPVAVLEAWQFRLPVLMTGECNLPEGFAAGAALAIEPEPESIFKGLVTFMQMPETEQLAYGQRGRALAERQFTWETIADRMLKVYRWCAGQAALPDYIRQD